MDAHKNFAYSTVATAPSPATTGTSLTVQTGDGTKFPQLAAPAAPTLAHAAASTSLGAGVVQVEVTYVTADGETLASSSTSVTISAGDNITITSPIVAALGAAYATGWYAYVTTVGGSTFVRQQTAGAPTAIGTSLVLTTIGTSGANPPTSNTAAPFNATVWPAGATPTVANSEIVRVTGIATNTFTIIRTRESFFGASSSARTIVVGDQIAAAITAKMITDLETGLMLVPIAPPVAPTVGNSGTAGSTSYTYALSAVNKIGGDTKAPNTTTTTTGNATLNGTNFNTITAPNIGDPRIVNYNVWRTAGGSSQGLIGNIAPGATLNDTGLTGTLTPQNYSSPQIDTSECISFGPIETVRGRLAQVNFFDGNPNGPNEGSGFKWHQQSANQNAVVSYDAGNNCLYLQVTDQFSNTAGFGIHSSFINLYGNLAVGTNGISNFGNPVTIDNPKLTVVAQTTTYSIADGDATITCDATTAAFTVTLPAGSTANVGVEHHIKKIDSSAHAVTVAMSGSDTVEGATTISLASQWAGVTVKHVGSGKWIKKP